MKQVILGLLCLGLNLTGFSQSGKEYLYVGTFSIRESKGIYVFEFNRVKGSLTLVQTIKDVDNPNYIAIHPSGKFLFTANRNPINGNPSYGSVSAFRINNDGKLTFINHVSSYGKEPCHLSIDKTGEWIFVSNYSEGNLVMLPILEDGSLGAASDSKKYFGYSVNKFRQEQPHIHSSEVSADNRYLYVSDLGTDKIYTYAIDHKKGKIIAAGKFETKVTPGAGPRHFAFHPNGKFGYSAQELSCTVGVFAIEDASGSLNLLQDTVRSLPKGITEVNTSADIHTDPKGKFLYLSNRGYDALSVFKINPEGSIELKGHQKTLGKTPRNFLIDKKGKYVIVANQNSDNITVFKINAKTGMLTYTGQQVKVPSPVCVKMR